MASCSVNFDKKAIVFITGASKGIGQTIAVNLARQLDQKSIFVLLARSEDGLNKTKQEIAEVDKAIAVQTYLVDLSKPNLDDYNQIFDKVLQTVDTNEIEFGIIFHNAGLLGDLKQTTDLTDLTVWREHFDLNVFSVSLINSVFVKKIRSVSPQLVVVNITSLAGRSPFKNLAMYGASKAAREIFFKVFAEEEPRVIVLNYSPGPVNTDMFHNICGAAQSEEVRNSFKTVAQTTILQPDQTVEKLLDILKKGDFKSGVTIDYYDTP